MRYLKGFHYHVGLFQLERFSRSMFIQANLRAKLIFSKSIAYNSITIYGCYHFITHMKSIPIFNVGNDGSVRQKINVIPTNRSCFKPVTYNSFKKSSSIFRRHMEYNNKEGQWTLPHKKICIWRSAAALTEKQYVCILKNLAAITLKIYGGIYNIEIQEICTRQSELTDVSNYKIPKKDFGVTFKRSW